MIKLFFILLLSMKFASASLLDSPYEWSSPSKVDIQELQKILLDKAPKEFEERVNFIRNFIIENSSFGSLNGEEFDFYFNHPQETLKAILEHSANKASPKPPMECYSRTLIMTRLLHYLGIKTRRIILFSDHEDFLTSHTLFEVFNPKTQEWAVHDSNANAYYIADNNKEPLSMKYILFKDLGKITPCQTPKKCGWKLFPGLKETIEKFGVILYDFSFDNKPNHIMINKNKFNLEKKFQPEQYFHSAKDRTPASFKKIIDDWWIENGTPTIEEMPSS